MDYSPRGRNAAILDRAWEHVQSVEYKVSLRWLFYRLLQDGLFSSKADYDNFKSSNGPMSKARKKAYKGWRPWTLSDDSRSPVVRNGEFETIEEWKEWRGSLQPSLDQWYNQNHYIEVWFEAKAMTEQFMYLVPELITLEPFGGDTSIPEKWKISQRIKTASKKYGLPVTILYFGDYDPKGLKIPYSAYRDIQPWSRTEFELKISGLTKEQVGELSLPENFEKPNEYQWEALSDSQAREIITNALAPYLKQNPTV